MLPGSTDPSTHPALFTLQRQDPACYKQTRSQLRLSERLSNAVVSA